jgi:hypothetical protein
MKTMIEIKRLDVDGADLSVVGIDAQPILMAAVDQVQAVAGRLAQGLPGAEVRTGQISRGEVEDWLGLTLAHEVDWDAWLAQVDGDTLLELFDLKYGGIDDPFYVNDAPDAMELYFHAYGCGELTAPELVDRLVRHPQTVVTGTVLQRDVEALLVELGIPATAGVMERVQQYTQELFGTSENFRRVVLEMVGDWARVNLMSPSPRFKWV